MRIVIDTCVLYPTVMREMVLGVAETGAFQPVWSERILEEWARAARKIGPTGEAQARAEIALVSAAFPRARVSVPAGLASRLWLPDDNDVHVLAAAVAASADAIITLNIKDFPRSVLAEEGLQRLDPDDEVNEATVAAMLYEPADSEPDLVVFLGPPTQLPPSLVWELAYAELVFVPIAWRELTRGHIERAIEDFASRRRRFGRGRDLRRAAEHGADGCVAVAAAGALAGARERGAEGASLLPPC